MQMPINDESELGKQLREEANTVKECFTRYCFQVLALTAIVMGFLARWQPEAPITGLASVLVIVLISTVARIGTYKYGVANRLIGYELHLSRTKTLLDQNGIEGWHSSMRKIGWEEAMRAWRIVQATVFDRIYYGRGWNFNKVKLQKRKNQDSWFEVKSLIDTDASYYPGSYLRRSIGMLHGVARICYLPLLAMLLQFSKQEDPSLEWALIPGSVIVVMVIIWTEYRARHTRARIRILEDGLLSIHSCGVLWQSVVVAHYHALKTLPDFVNEKVPSLRGYTKNLSREAVKIAINIYDISDYAAGR